MTSAVDLAVSVHSNRTNEFPITNEWRCLEWFKQGNARTITNNTRWGNQLLWIYLVV